MAKLYFDIIIIKAIKSKALNRVNANFASKLNLKIFLKKLFE